MTTLISVIGMDGVGKDTVANMLRDCFTPTAMMYSNASTLRRFVCRFIEVDINRYEEIKRSGQLFYGKTLRYWMIFFAEKCFKPTFGNTFFTKQVISAIEEDKLDYCIKTDDRYWIEFNANNKVKTLYVLVLREPSDMSYLLENKPFSEEQIKEKPYLIELQQFVSTYKLNSNFLVLQNDGALEELRTSVNKLHKDILDICDIGW